MVTAKDRRHSGRKEIFCDDEDYPTQICEYDEWNSYKDGQRDKSTQIKNITPKEFSTEEEYWNHRKNRDKIRKKEKIRKIKKEKIKLLN